MECLLTTEQQIACYRTDILQEAGMTLEDFTDITWDEWLKKAK